MSSLTDGDSSAPDFGDTSKGSSVSSGFLNEYEEMLKYAIVAPKLKLGPDVYDDPVPQEKHVSNVELSATLIPTSGDRACRDTPKPITAIGVSEKKLTNRPTVQATSFKYSTKSTSEHGSVDASTLPAAFKPRAMKPSSSHALDTLLEFSTTPSKTPDSDARSDAGDASASSSPSTVNGSPAIDKDILRMDSLMDDWLLQLKRNILGEFADIKMRQLQHQRDEVDEVKQKHAAELLRQHHEVESLKELLYSFEQNVAQKDVVINNLTAALSKQQERSEKIRTFTLWRLQLNDQRRESFASKLALKHYERNLSGKVWSGWRSVVESRWRQRVEKACQVKSQEVCLKLTEDYEERIQALQKELESSRAEVAAMHRERECYEETMKKAFMRGVCALNMEAMSMFREGRSDLDEPRPTNPISSNESESGEDHFHCSEQPVERSSIGNDARSQAKHVTFASSLVSTAQTGSKSSSSMSGQTVARPNSAHGQSQTKKTLHVRATGKKDLASARRSASGTSQSAAISSVMVERHIPVEEHRSSHPVTSSTASLASSVPLLPPSNQSNGRSSGMQRPDGFKVAMPKTNLVKVVD